ncbi:MAG: peptide ABC transporter substrate-binding protein [Alphaproteobacteria bacterium]|nr:peptide ABC transporter substrate-binding protein [Alphaproteobacteria bacterium]
MRCLLAAVGLAAALATPATAQPPTPGAKDELVIGITQFPATFNPYIEAMLAKSYVLAMTRRPMVVYDKEWKLVCMLCTELPTLENGKAKVVDLPGGGKGMTITWTIQPEAKWGDGKTLSVDDFVFAWEVGRHPKSGVPEGEPFRRIQRIEAHGPKSFTVHVDKVRFDYSSYFALDPLPAHLDRIHFADPENYRRRTAYDSDTGNPGLYNGPYRITNVALGSHVVLEPSPSWYGAKPYFKKITVRAIENTAALEANLLSGSIDYIAGELGLSLDQGLAFEKRHGARFDIQYKPGLIYEHIDLNLDNPVLKDRRVREALLVSVDREAIARQLFEGKQPVAHSFVNPLDWIAATDLPGYAFDAARAAKLLDEAGWSRLQAGFRHNDKGERLGFELMTTAGNRTREAVQQVLQSQWRRVGIDVRLRNEPPRVFFGETVRRRAWSSMVMYAWLSSPESVPRSTLHSTSIPTAENNWSGQNNPAFRNAEMDSLIETIEVELDREKRRLLWRRVQEIYMQEIAVLPLFFRSDPFVVPKWLAGIEPTGHQGVTTLWIENWRAR